MSEIKDNIARNLVALRKNKKLTQQELAEKMDYTDKSISKWEHGEALPDIETLANICDFYNIDLNYLVSEHADSAKILSKAEKGNRINRSVISGLAISLVWITAIIVCISTQMFTNYAYWMSFVWALPFSFMILTIFNAIWGDKRRPAYITCFAWTALTALYLELGFDMPNGDGWRLWMLFLLGVPTTIAAILWSHLKDDQKY